MDREVLIIEEVEAPFSSIGLFRLFKDEPYLSFLDSGIGKQRLGRFSFLGFDPFLIFRSKGGCIQIIEDGKTIELKKDNPFYILKGLLNKYRLDIKDISLPFTGGAVGYFSYELRHYIEELPSRAPDDINIPDCYLLFYDTVIIFDHLKDKAYIASCGFPELERDRRKARARERLDNIKEKINRANIKMPPKTNPCSWFLGLGRELGLTSNFKKKEYLSAIREAKEYIARGDIYQVNLSQRFSCKIEISPDALFENLRSINPAPFAAYLNFGDVKIVSASPERFLCKRGRNIHTRPIKGTRPRGRGPVEDEKMKIELINSPKDRAEHIMIVDLERNDLGRICEYGTVLPAEFITLEKYATVFHLVSTVGGMLREEIDAIDSLINCFPGGSITGAPKIRSMEIIDKLEPTKRSVYTGSIGYIGFNGNMDTSIVIRTFIIKDSIAYFQVGGAIVADSDPEMEYQETLDKAKALIQSLSSAAGGVASVLLR